ncbi:CheR family methyltransferase [Halioxenophilus aromaticivorans]|uniref:protein-glutamate O-methyltransferase n=1 Tax=Halioxenophilus aromaticivorans TaxID=1306992 RepID=A0AAV3TZR0_9ALTE
MKPDDPKLTSENELLTNIDPAEFDQFRNLLETASGIHLPTSKQYLVATRLRRIMHDHSFGTLRQLIDNLKQSGPTGLKAQVVEAMTTNETFWFRDSYPFHYLSNELLPQWLSKPLNQRIRVWCAACSSGQEPYSLAMIAAEYARKHSLAAPPIEIMATDISEAMLTRCRSGIYDHLELTRGLSNTLLTRYFDDVGEGSWQVKDALRKQINFRRLNLVESFSSFGRFDIVFCRNVLIYFSADLKTDILARIHQQLQPEGVLFLGASEGLGNASSLFSMVQCNPGIAYRSVQK